MSDEHGIPESHEELTAEVPLRPIRSKKAYQRAMKLARRLVVRDDLNKDQEDYLAVLELLVGEYEEAHFAHPDVEPIDLLKFLLEENDMSGSDLGRLLGQRELGSAILRGERQLSKAHIKKVSERFKIDAGFFLAAHKSRRRTQESRVTIGKAGDPGRKAAAKSGMTKTEAAHVVRKGSRPVNVKTIQAHVVGKSVAAKKRRD